MINSTWRDSIGQILNDGDEIIFAKGSRTPAVFRGKIIGFTPHRIKVEYERIVYRYPKKPDGSWDRYAGRDYSKPIITTHQSLMSNTRGMYKL